MKIWTKSDPKYVPFPPKLKIFRTQPKVLKLLGKALGRQESLVSTNLSGT